MIQTQIEFHKSTSPEAEHPKEHQKALTQKELVLELLSDGVARTSMEVQRCLKINLNSVRRSLSNLERDGFINKLESGRIETEGKLNHFYQKK